MFSFKRGFFLLAPYLSLFKRIMELGPVKVDHGRQTASSVSNCIVISYAHCIAWAKYLHTGKYQLGRTLRSKWEDRLQKYRMPLPHWS